MLSDVLVFLKVRLVHVVGAVVPVPLSFEFINDESFGENRSVEDERFEFSAFACDVDAVLLMEGYKVVDGVFINESSEPGFVESFREHTDNDAFETRVHLIPQEQFLVLVPEWGEGFDAKVMPYFFDTCPLVLGGDRSADHPVNGEALEECFQVSKLYFFFSFRGFFDQWDSETVSKLFREMNVDGMEHPGVLILWVETNEVGDVPAVLLRNVNCECGIFSTGEQCCDAHLV